MSEITILRNLFDQSEPEELLAHFKELQATGGGWETLKGVEVRADLVYPDFGDETLEEIYSELEDGHAVAVTYQERAISEKMTPLVERVQIAAGKIPNYYAKILAGVASRTSKFTKCPGCGSAIAVQYIKELNCRYCGSEELLMNNSHHKYIASLQASLDKFKGQLREALLENKGEVVNSCWLIVGRPIQKAEVVDEPLQPVILDEAAG